MRDLHQAKFHGSPSFARFRLPVTDRAGMLLVHDPTCPTRVRSIPAAPVTGDPVASPVASPGTPADAIAIANRQQGVASDPDVSAFVSASAGSGKTKLLIDRLLRLMLPRPVPGDPQRRLAPGTDPARIQCLTFTKAAAAEMSIRLQRELGRWVTLDDAALDARLASLGCVGGAALRQPARALFARVLDLPGGMRIGTIHAF
jgi:ATP-dependent helicase/nuclease subunit A